MHQELLLFAGSPRAVYTQWVGSQIEPWIGHHWWIHWHDSRPFHSTPALIDQAPGIRLQSAQTKPWLKLCLVEDSNDRELSSLYKMQCLDIFSFTSHTKQATKFLATTPINQQWPRRSGKTVQPSSIFEKNSLMGLFHLITARTKTNGVQNVCGHFSVKATQHLQTCNMTRPSHSAFVQCVSNVKKEMKELQQMKLLGKISARIIHDRC